MGSSARRAKNVPPACFLNARSNPFGYYANQNKRHPKRVPFVLVRPKGFEPPISGIGIRCVIQLRHGRMLHVFSVQVILYHIIFETSISLTILPRFRTSAPAPTAAPPCGCSAPSAFHSRIDLCLRLFQTRLTLALLALLLLFEEILVLRLLLFAARLFF